MSDNQYVAPDLSQPLIHEPEQSNPPPSTTPLGPLKNLVGTWTNQNIPGQSRGGPESPFSYCLMPLPQNKTLNPELKPVPEGGPNADYDTDGYILKNFSYYEELTFSPINGTVNNRGGDVTEVANTLFYEQRVYFADGPGKDSLVHAENGTLLFLTAQAQQAGPYGDGSGDGNVNQIVPVGTPPSAKYKLVKQMSVPHGNSILAEGTVATGNGAPTIGVPEYIYPEGALDKEKVLAKYSQQSPGNQTPEYTNNPNMPLMEALEAAQPTHYIHLHVDNQNGDHQINNIGFEQAHADVTRYFIDYWLESFDKAGTSDPQYTQLQYSQTVFLDLLIEVDGKMQKVSFPHLLTNTLTKKA